eukprot:TRINITY_DN4138_c0_g1_i1.p1 TRINITY_DN4138_c0_g1~~TRINITY_DN4138_c0_g1_i1.p1  ORF type:complete len:311 (-),score=100.94 TRINITY_DN4138_c0_g1_i1:473-1405(-)
MSSSSSSSSSRSSKSDSDRQALIAAIPLLNNVYALYRPAVDQKIDKSQQRGVASLTSASTYVLLTLTDGTNVWQTKLGYDEFVAHKKQLGLDPSLTWKNLFEMLKKALETPDKLLLESIDSSSSSSSRRRSSSMSRSSSSSNSSQSRSLTIIYTLSKGVDLCGSFVVPYLSSSSSSSSKEKEKEEEEDKDRKEEMQKVKDTKTKEIINQMLIKLFERSLPSASHMDSSHSELAQVKTENATLKATVESLREQVNSLEAEKASLTSSSQSDDAKSEETKKRPLIKKEDMSVVNPRMKRRKHKGAKIGEGTS